MPHPSVFDPVRESVCYDLSENNCEAQKHKVAQTGTASLTGPRLRHHAFVSLGAKRLGSLR